MAGRDTRVTVQRFDDQARSPLNEPVGAWQTHCTVWASRKDVSNAESSVAGAMGSVVQTEFQLRSNLLTRAITPADRLMIGARVWNIKGILLNGHALRGDLVTIIAVADSTGGNA